ncbi:D-alanyl-D-alanine carboxypeptidase/D-alanyl-D-alanine-endopeptidase [Streptomyces sp. NPDC048362]|uniref:D-alanyl-D-alanine carboxypeptidase/D-alanyl-D-alanine endopeptidase n=1 Tax=Streptomyces sp. NPDC048362 TaxID=3365539 RepID=UPI00371BD5D6
MAVRIRGLFIRWAGLVTSLLLVAAVPAARLPEEGKREVANAPASLIEAIKKVTSQPRYRGSFWGFDVQDAKTGDVLYKANSDKMFTPGSVMKIFSTSTVLESLGQDYRFITPVYRTGSLIKGRLDGNLVLVGSGDFEFGLRERADGTLAYTNAPAIDHNYADTGLPGAQLIQGNPLAVLDELAAQVKRTGVTHVSGQVVVDDRLFTPFAGWPDGPISPIWVNENVIDVTVTPGAAGAKAVVDYRPKTSAYSVISEVNTVPSPQKTHVAITLDGAHRLRVSGQITEGSKPVVQIWQIPKAASFARSAFIDALHRAGITTNASATGDNPSRLLPHRVSYSKSREIAHHTSPQLKQYIKVILKVSYNRGADDMICLTAVKAGSTNCLSGLTQELQTIAKLGVSKSSTILFDGAGSDERDRTSPHDLAVMCQAVGTKPYADAVRDALPILGVDGTFATTGHGTPAAGHVELKSGTRGASSPDDRQGILTGSSQTGYITAKSGRQLVFSNMMANAPFASAADITAINDEQSQITIAVQAAY